MKQIKKKKKLMYKIKTQLKIPLRSVSAKIACRYVSGDY